MRRSLPSLEKVAVVTDAFIFTIVREGPAPASSPGAEALFHREPAPRPEVTAISLEDSITVGNLLGASAARYAGQKRFRVERKEPGTVGLSLDTGKQLRVIQKKGNESQEVPAPFHVDSALMQDEPYRGALRSVENRLVGTSSLTERVSPSDFVLGGPEMEGHLAAIRERTGCDGLLVIAGTGLALPTGRKVAKIISEVVATAPFMGLLIRGAAVSIMMGRGMSGSPRTPRC